MWNDTLPVCENTGQFSPRLIYLQLRFVQQPVSWAAVCWVFIVLKACSE